MDILHAVILGIIEGVTEFLPISSTGHLILASEILRIEQTDVVKSFNIAIQLGAISAVVALYFKSFFDIELIKRLVVGFIPTGVIGFALYPFIKASLLGNPLVVVVSLFLGGIALLAFEYLYKEPTESAQASPISLKQAFIVGLFQSIAMVPGVSRAAATIAGGLLVGIRRAAIVEFSFLLAVPTMVAATGYDLLKSSHLFSEADLTLLAVGFVISFLVALVSMRVLVAFVRTHSFVPFGIYRILIAIAFFFVVL